MTITSSRYRIEKAKWISPYDDKSQRVRACRVSGLLDLSWYGKDDEEGRPWIDASIAKLIVAFNRAGYITEFCCSGLPEDHENPTCLAGYIMFNNLSPNLFPLPHGLKWDGDLSIRRKDNISSTQLKQAWIELEASVHELLEQTVKDLS